MKRILIFLFGGMVAGCSVTSPAAKEQAKLQQAREQAKLSAESQFNRELLEFASRDVSQWPKRLLIGFPAGKPVPVSDSQARKLQLILSYAQPEPYREPVPGLHESPSHQLCVLEIADRIWYFMPPGNPARFRLPPSQRKQFEQMMRQEFGL